MHQVHRGIFCLVFILAIASFIALIQAGSVKRENDFVKKVHIIFMNHLDVGYADFAGAIINRYMVTFFPRAIELARNLTTKGYVETFSYTTHPWLVSLYLDCPPNLVLNKIKIQCPDDKSKTEFITAIQKGIITWHAGPMNLYVETASDWLYSAGLSISAELDKRFNITRPIRVLSQRDVPGVTESVVPLLVKNGISAISVGVNSGTPPPLVPRLFIWKKGSSSVIANWHPGGYPNNPGSDPSSPGGLSRDDCITWPGFPEALCLAFRTDNSGPPVNDQEILADYEILRAEFPNAELVASRFDDFFAAVDRSIKSELPVFVGEIADTWVQGVSSDPRKAAEYRVVARVMGQCVAEDRCKFSDSRVWNATRFLIKIPEHTLGLDSTHDNVHWSNEDFYKFRTTAQNFINCTNSWLEQRRFIYLILEALEDHPVVSEINQQLKQLIANKPDLSGFVEVSDHEHIFQCPKGNIKSLKFGKDGSIDLLNYNNVDWASDESPMSSFLYRTYDEKDFIEFGKLYDYTSTWRTGFYKDNVTLYAHPESKVWPFHVTGLYTNKAAECDFYISIEPNDNKAISYYGAPRMVWYRYSVRSPTSNPAVQAFSVSPGIDITMQWFDKTITRLPESLTLSFKVKPQSQTSSSYKWLMSKMGTMVDPLNVTLNGSQYQHGVDDNGVSYMSQSQSSIRIRSIDVPVVCPIVSGDEPHIFPAPLAPIQKPIVGMAYNIYNNLWDTNFIYWYPYVPGDQNFKARFSIDFFTGSYNEDIIDENSAKNRDTIVGKNVAEDNALKNEDEKFGNEDKELENIIRFFKS